jgi:hypothetical protein
MTHKEWVNLSSIEQEAAKDNSSLTPQLIGLEGWRVEVVDMLDDDTQSHSVRRFIVGKSTGWKPIHLEIPRRDSIGGPAAAKEYRKVTKLYYTR